jgi:REP element-mobilizing transposase RayT
MARMARAEVFAPDEIAIVHVMNRTVRRCFLLGDDPVSGKNFDHRKDWMEDQLEIQARHFGIDLICYALMSNHFHLILRSRPDVVATWDDSEVARRWLMLCPKRKPSKRGPSKRKPSKKESLNDESSKSRRKEAQATEPTQSEIDAIVNDPVEVQELRSRLSDISWWMRLLSQKIGSRANRDDNEVGKFWQSRFKGVKLLDEASILACAAYVDLNPIRAAIAENLEGSTYTSAQQRVLELQSKVAKKGRAQGKSAKRGNQRPMLKSIAGALCPVGLTEGRSGVGACVHTEGQRASDKGFLRLSTAEYLELLDWTARKLKTGKRGATPKCAPPLFERLGIDERTWLELTRDFGRLFSTVAGKPTVIDATRSPKRGQRYNVPAKTRELFAS